MIYAHSQNSRVAHAASGAIICLTNAYKSNEGLFLAAGIRETLTAIVDDAALGEDARARARKALQAIPFP